MDFDQFIIVMISVNLIKIVLASGMLIGTACGAMSQADIGPGTRSFALGETGLGFQDINAAYTNPAGLQGLSAFSIQASVARPFSIPELSQVQLAAASNLSTTDFLFATVAAKGNSDFRQSRISIGYGRKLTDDLSVALELETLLLFIRGYGNDLAIGYSISFQHRPFDQLIIGAHIHNPVPVTKEGAVVPKSTFSVGLAYLISDIVSINTEIFKDTQFKFRFKSGLEYKVHPAFTVRFGATTNPTQLHFGVGWDVRDRNVIDFSIGYQTLLGLTPSVGISYRASTSNL